MEAQSQSQLQSRHKKGEAPLNPQKQSNEEARPKSSEENAIGRTGVDTRLTGSHIEGEENGKVELKDVRKTKKKKIPNSLPCTYV